MGWGGMRQDGIQSSLALQGEKLMEGCYVAGDTVPPQPGLAEQAQHLSQAAGGKAQPGGSGAGMWCGGMGHPQPLGAAMSPARYQPHCQTWF